MESRGAALVNAAIQFGVFGFLPSAESGRMPSIGRVARHLTQSIRPQLDLSMAKEMCTNDLELLEKTGCFRIVGARLSPMASESQLRDALVFMGRSDSIISLSIEGSRALRNLSLLANCSGLRHLMLGGYGCDNLISLEGLENCSKLRYLDLGNCMNLADVSALRSCIRLEELHLSFCWSLRDVSALGACTLLHTLDLCECLRLMAFDISSLAACSELIVLVLPPSTSSDQLIGLSRFKKLRTLKIKYSKRLDDISPVAAFCTGLQRLDLTGCNSLQDDDLALLTFCSQLRFLNLTKCCFTLSAIRSLESRFPELHIDHDSDIGV